MTVPAARQDARMSELATALGHARNSLDDFHDALRHVNDDQLTRYFQPVREAADKILARHEQRPNVTIADDVAHLRSLFARIPAPREDSELGPLSTLKALRAARGNVFAELEDVLAAARALGWRPAEAQLSEMLSAEMPRTGIERQLAALVARMDQVERLLREKVQPEGEVEGGRSIVQVQLVTAYVDTMRNELMLARLEASSQSRFDIIALGRTIENIGRLTADFVTTVQGFARKVTESLQEAASILRSNARKLAIGFQIIVRRVSRNVATSAHFKGSSSYQGVDTYTQANEGSGRPPVNINELIHYKGTPVHTYSTESEFSMQVTDYDPKSATFLVGVGVASDVVLLDKKIGSPMEIVIGVQGAASPPLGRENSIDFLAIDSEPEAPSIPFHREATFSTYWEPKRKRTSALKYRLRFWIHSVGGVLTYGSVVVNENLSFWCDNNCSVAIEFAFKFGDSGWEFSTLEPGEGFFQKGQVVSPVASIFEIRLAVASRARV